MKFITYIITASFILCLTGCSCQDSSHKQAKIDGMKAAVNVISNIGKGNMAMENTLLEAKAIQSKYAKNDSIAAKKFDLSFRNYIITHNDSLAKKIF